MRKIPLDMLVYLGGSSRFLLSVKEGFMIHGRHHIAVNIDRVLDVLKDLRFTVTLAASRELQTLRKELDAPPEYSKISLDAATRLREIMSPLEHTLRAEGSTMTAYVLSEKRFEAVRLV